MAHPASNKYSAFTLLETVVAAAITVLLLGAVTGINHTIQNSIAREQDTAQMGALADEGISQVQFWRDAIFTYQSSSPLINGNKNGGINISQSGSDTDMSATGTFYVSSPTSGNCLNNTSTSSSCPRVENGGPLVMLWCQTGVGGNPKCADGKTAEKFLVSPIATHNHDCDPGSCNASNLLNSVNTPLGNADITAVRMIPFQTSDPCVKNTGYDTCRFMVDLSNPITGETTFLDTTLTRSNWRYYSRTIQIIRPGGINPCDNSTTAGFYSDFGTISPQCVNLRANTLYVRVTVVNTFNPNSSVSRTIMLSNTAS